MFAKNAISSLHSALEGEVCLNDLDPRSIGLSFALCILMLAIVLATSRRDERTPGVDWLVASSVSGGLGLGLSALQATIDDFFGLTLGNTLLCCSLLFAIVGLRTLRRVDNGAKYAVAIALIAFVFNVVTVYVSPDVKLRIVVNTVLIAAASYLCGFEYLRLTRKQSMFALYFGAVPCLLFATLMAVRAATVALAPDVEPGIATSGIGTLIYLVGSVSFTATVIAMLMVVNAIRANRVKRLAYRDSLTNALSRRGLYSVLESWLEKRPLGATVAVLDIDRFKNVNDHCGHDEGDRLLKLLAEVCRRCVPADSLVARLGGDEFVLLFPIGTAVEQTCDEIQHMFDRKRRQLVDASAKPDHAIYLMRASASIGTAMIGGKSLANFASAMRAADVEMYAQKQMRRSGDTKVG
jgi:diguanylate cyclase (GGDEF)-like protein